MLARDRDSAVAEHGLEEVLVHAQRRGRDAGADVRHPGELEQPLHGPVLAERPVQDRQHDVDAAERAGAAAVGIGRPAPRSVDGGRSRRRRQRPGAVAPDLDHVRLVAGGLERSDHGSGRGERDLVLARAATGEHGDAQAPLTGRTSSSSPRVGRRRHVDRDVAADEQRHDGGRILLGVPRGILRDHDAVEGLHVGVLQGDADLEPGRLQRRLGVLLGLARDVRQRRVWGPFETERLTVAPLVAVEEPLGTWLTTSPAGCSLSTSVRATAKPAAWSCWSAVGVVEPDDGRHGDGLRAGRVVDPHPCTFDERRAGLRILRGDRARGLVRGHADALRREPGGVSVATASVSCFPTTSGTSPLLAVETWIVTIPPRASFVPSTGDCSKNTRQAARRSGPGDVRLEAVVDDQVHGTCSPRCRCTAGRRSACWRRSAPGRCRRGANRRRRRHEAERL